MSIDINRFQAVFFEECNEGLEALEAGLLCLSSNPSPDPETIHTIFRAAHSIKGGSGSFGFEDVTEFTHKMETLLDQMRTGGRAADPEVISALLASVDVLKLMLAARKEGRQLEEAKTSDAAAKLSLILSGTTPQSRVAAICNAEPRKLRKWNIAFRPFLHLLKTGNEPLRILRELAELGDLKVVADTSKIPALSELDPEDCLIGWRLELAGAVQESELREVFDWVEGDCVLEVAEVTTVKAPIAEINDPVPVRAMTTTEGSSLRVSTEKVDAIINLVGELVITQSMLSQFGDHFEMSMIEKLRDGLSQLARNTRELQETVLKIRMLPISFCFNRFPRLVHDLSEKLGKKVNLRLAGEQTEVDKTVLEKINEPLLHLVRNAIDHGIETSSSRLAAGKSETGTLLMQASHRGGNIVIEIGDDGAGLDTARILERARQRGLIGASETLSKERIEELIFAPGFSTAATLTEVSGRGVGMDVVRRNIKELGGNIEIDNRPGKGTTFIIRLPLTLAILDGQIVRVGEQTFVVPLVSIVESVQVQKEHISSIGGAARLYRLRDQYLPILKLHEIFRIPPSSGQLDQGLLMVIEDNGQQAGIFVDDLLAQQQVVIKSMESNFQRIEGISGATILGDGTVSMILDIPGILTLSKRQAAA
jgi:two-component system, chemotaxis family, sensor kinase CheA